jgi:D-mannonate dehydratase
VPNIIKKIRKQKNKKATINLSTPENTWVDDEGLHYIGIGSTPNDEELEMMTKEYQQRIKKSLLWKQMVRQFGKTKAEEMLKEFQVKPG